MCGYQQETIPGEVILQIPTSLRLASHYKVNNTAKKNNHSATIS